VESAKTRGQIYNTINGLCLAFVNKSQQAMVSGLLAKENQPLEADTHTT
jgi:hypothetical protein